MSEKSYTLAIIKPTAFQKGYLKAILAAIRKAGFTIEAKKEKILTLQEAKTLYQVHSQKPFYQEYCLYMSSGPVLVIKLSKENAVEEFRKLIGATDPKDAAPGTIRKRFGTNIEDNAIHGSDSPENAQQEITFFFGN